MDRISMITALFARALAIKSIGGDSLSYIGVTTTALSDGATTNPITIDGDTVTATNGNVALYGGDAFVFNGTIWQASSAISQIFTEIGDLSDLDTEAKTDLVSAINEVNEEKQDDVNLSLTPTAVVSDRDIQDGQGNTLSVLAEALTKTASGNPVVISDCAGGKARSLITAINVIQDLHGLPFPYVGGAYKNKCPYFTGTTVANIEYTVANDGKVSFTGTPSAPSEIRQDVALKAGTYIVSGAPTGSVLGSKDIYVQLSGTTVARSYDGVTESAATFALSEDSIVRINLRAASSASETAISGTYEPMIRPSTESAGYAPYSNICPISGRTAVAVDDTGKNQFDKDHVSSFAGFIDTATNTYKSNSAYKLCYIPCEGNTTYTISKVAGKTFRVASSVGIPAADVPFINTAANHTGTTLTFTTAADAHYLAVLYWSSANGDTLTPEQIEATLQIEIGSTATSYEPYAHSSATIQLGQTVYGADINWDTGVMTVKHKIIDLGSVNWSHNTPNRQFYCDVISDMENTSSFFIDGIISSCYKVDVRTYADYNDAHCRGINGQRVYIVDTRTTDADTFKTLVTGQTVRYPLATPTTIQLTPTEVQMLKGYNRVTIDNGTITLDYIAKAISGNDEEIAPLVGDKATKSYAVNDFIERNDGLYRVTASIASGASFTANNTVKMSIGEALTYLYNK